MQRYTLPKFLGELLGCLCLFIIAYGSLWLLPLLAEIFK